MTSEETIRAYFDAYQGKPELFDKVISPDYVDYGHTPPGHGLKGARDDYDQMVTAFGGVPTFDFDAIVADDKDNVAVVWTGHLPNGGSVQGLSLYRVSNGQVLEIRHTILEPKK
jgi:hypothetical protein